MKPLQTFTIIPSLPEKLTFLKTLSYNLWWSWNHDAIDLFRRLDRDLWEITNHNPIKMLGQIKQERLEILTNDDGFLSHLERVSQELNRYLHEITWYEKDFGKSEEIKIAYFSAEFGLTECVPIYSGGLGILAGDHVKSASDLGLPFAGIGILYQQGYFHQYLNADGWQGELYPRNDFYNMPIQLQKDDNENPILIEVDFPERKVYAQIWKLQVGRINLFLLDTNISENNEEDKTITGELYGGDNEKRIQQEIVLGIGGVRALKTLGINPTVFHMNEGHSAFLALERIVISMQENNLNFDQALELTKAGNIFTTHTPVPAGIDRFSPKLMEKYFSNYFPQLQINKSKFFSLGKFKINDSSEKFSMAILAIRLASRINGVSKLHKKVSQKMWHELWEGIPENEIPISSVTNGIHPGSYISRELAGLYDRYLGPTWKKKPADLAIWKRVDQIPGEELWRTHERRRERLVAFARIRLKNQLNKKGVQNSEIEKVEDILNPEALTIGFARRFATYKRANLVFHDPEKFAKILNQKDRPVQIIFSGKAHPNDKPGKDIIKKIAFSGAVNETLSYDGKFVLGKYHEGNIAEEELSSSIANTILTEAGFSSTHIAAVLKAINALYNENLSCDIYCRILHDADRLEKLGSIGVANFFTKMALRGTNLSEALLSSLSRELTYALVAPKTMLTKSGKKFARPLSKKSFAFFTELLHELKEWGVGEFIVREVHPRERSKVVLVVPKNCINCKVGNYSLSLTTEQGIKCEKLVATFTCDQCSATYTVQFCLPLITHA